MMRSLLPSLLDRGVIGPRYVDRLFDDDLFDRWFDGLFRWPAIQSQYTRPFEIRETDGAYVVRCELPGYDANDVHVELTGDVLTVRAQASEGGDGEGLRRQDSFVQSLRLGIDLDRDKVQAELKNGVLMILLPKSEAMKPKRVEIKTSSTGGTPQIEHRPGEDPARSAGSEAGSARSSAA